MRRILCSFIALTALLGASAHAENVPTNLTVLADNSLALPLAQLARSYTQTTGQATTIVILGTSDAAQQIAQGLDANVLITANSSLIETLGSRGLVDVFGKRDIARTQLALAAPAALMRGSDLATHISFTAILYAQPNWPIYITPETSPDGARAHTLMRSEAYSAPLLARTVMLENHTAVMEKLAQAPGFTLMLATDALREPSLKILNIVASDGVEALNYQAVLVAGANVEDARHFLDYLTSKPAQEVLSHYGFQPPTGNDAK